jgi:hypothetical protein
MIKEMQELLVLSNVFLIKELYWAEGIFDG